MPLKLRDWVPMIILRVLSKLLLLKIVAHQPLDLLVAHLLPLLILQFTLFPWVV